MTASLKRPKILTHRDLDVWQRAMDLADFCYDITENFPKREIFGLAAQIRKAASSMLRGLTASLKRHQASQSP